MLFCTMKRKLSVSLEEKTLSKLDKFIQEGVFRNKSHIIEFAVNKLLEDKENERS